MRQIKITPSITNRDSHSLDKYLVDINKIGMIGAEEEVALARRIRMGDQSALNKLVSANLRFVVSVSKKFQNKGLSLNDLINEGNLGLVKAAMRFDETRGFKFISYAVWWIRQGILAAIAEQSRTVRLPFNQLGNITKLYQVYSKLEQEHERDPSIEELAEAMDSTVDHIADIVSKSGKQLSIDEPLRNEEGSSLLDILPNTDNATDNGLLKESLSLTIDKALNRLPERERHILILFYGIGQIAPFSLQDIGQQLGLTQERIRQLRDKSLLFLRKHSVKQNLFTYFEDY